MSKKILLVEDDNMLCTVFDMFISDLGYELVGVTRNGNDAINFCSGYCPDIVIMDIHLEGEMDGIETAKIINERYEVPIIFLSSDFEKETINKAVIANTYGFLSKPIYKNSLGAAIEFAIAKYNFENNKKN